MILAAGRGARLRPWTDTTPKPLLCVGGQHLIEYPLRALAAAGFTRVAINVAYRGGQIMRALGDGSRYGLRIVYSREQPGALDTGGGIRRALKLLDDAPFAVLNADVCSDYPVAQLAGALQNASDAAHLVLVPNPPHHPQGDFGLQQGRVVMAGQRHTFAGIGVYRPALFAAQPARFPLSAVLRESIAAGRASGQLYSGRWFDVGTRATFAALGGDMS